MATRFELVLEGQDESHLRAAGEAAIEEIEEQDRRLSLFRSDSLTSHVNRCAATGWVGVDDEFFDLLDLCDHIHRESAGAFDAAGGAWVDVGLDPALRRVRFSTHPGRIAPRLDFGATGKGLALDNAAELLRDAGIERAFLHGGTSTALAIGSPPGRDGFNITVEALGQPRSVSIDGEALSVSARVQRLPDGTEQDHILDYRANRADAPNAPEDSLVGAAAVCAIRAPTASLADAWSTAALLMGRLPTIARRAGVELVLLEQFRKETVQK